MKYCLFLFGAAFVMLTACSPKTTATVKTVPRPTASNVPLTAQTVLARCIAQTPKATWLSGEVGLDYVGKPMSIGASGTIVLRRDSVLWLAVRKLGFNVARAKVSRDSILLVNYIQKYYIAQPLKYLEEQYGLPADFDKIQQLLLGEPLLVTNPNELTLQRSASGDWLLKGKNAEWTAEYTIDSTRFTLLQMNITQTQKSRTIAATFDRYDDIATNQAFATLRTITVSSPQTGVSKLTLEVELPIEINVAKGTKLAIPEDYERQ